MRQCILTSVLVLFAASPALADYKFFGYGLQWETSPLLSGPSAGTALNDRVLYFNQGEPFGLVVDAQFFGLTGLGYLASCGLEGGACPSANNFFRGGGYHRLAALDAQISLDLNGWHAGLGLASELLDLSTANGRVLGAGVGGELSLAKSRLGPLYFQVDAGAMPTFNLAGNGLVGVRTRGELLAVLAIPWVGVYASAGYQAHIPLDGGALEHGPYVAVGAMFSVSTLFGALGLVGDIGSGVKDVVGGGKK